MFRSWFGSVEGLFSQGLSTLILLVEGYRQSCAFDTCGSRFKKLELDPESKNLDPDPVSKILVPDLVYGNLARIRIPET